MKKQLCRVAVIVLSFAGLAGASSEPEQKDDGFEQLRQLFAEAEKQGQELEPKMYELMQRLPDVFDPAAEESRIRQIASSRAEMEALDVKPVAGAERVLFANGWPSPVELHRIEISGRDPFGKVHALLVGIGIHTWRYVDLETMHVQAEEDGTVSFTARLAYARYAPLEEKTELEGESREESLRRMILTRQMTYELLQGLAARSTPARLVDAMAVFGHEMEERAVGLTELRFEGETVLQGVVLGTSARDGLEPALEKAGFRMGDLRLSPSGACQAFAVKARLEPAEESDEIVIGNGLFDGGTAAFCEPASAAGRVEVHGTAPVDRSLTLHLRSVELVDVFAILNELTSQSFLLDDDVKGSIHLDAEGATMEEALAAMSAVGIAVGPGPVRRVSHAGKPHEAAPPSVDYSGERLDLRNRDASLGQTLCVLGHLAQHPILAPGDLRGAVHMYASELRVDQVIEALLSKIGYVSVLDGDHLLIGPGSPAEVRSRKDGVDVCGIPEPDGPSSRLSELFVPLPRLGAADFDLAGLGRAGDAWQAYAYTPTRHIVTLKAGDALSGARVDAVGPAGVAIATDASGVVNLTLRP